MKAQKWARLFLSLFASITLKNRIGTNETNLHNRIHIQPYISWITSIQISIIRGLDSILNTTLKIGDWWLDVIDIVNGDVTVLVKVAVLNKDRSGGIICVDLEQMRVCVDFIWAPDHQYPLDIRSVVNFQVNLGLCDCAKDWYLAAVDDYCAAA